MIMNAVFYRLHKLLLSSFRQTGLVCWIAEKAQRTQVQLRLLLIFLLSLRSHVSALVKQVMPAAVFIALVCLSGCYHLGSPGALSFSSLYIAPAQNDTYIPQAQSLISSQLRKQFLREGKIVVDDKADADAILYTKLTQYTTSTAATNEKETGLPQSFSFGLTASISLYSCKEQKMILENRTITSSIVTQIDGGAQISEYQSIPTLAQELALKIKETLLNPW